MKRFRPLIAALCLSSSLAAAQTPSPAPDPVPDPTPLPDPSAPPASDSAGTAVPADQNGPVISVPPEVDAVSEPAPTAQPPAATAGQPPPEDDPALYGLKQQRMARADSTSLGGYAELHYALEHVVGPGETAASMDLHRMVVFVAHRFDEAFRFYTEIEIEHAIASPGRSGGVDLEQAYLDWLIAGEALGLRAGMMVVPFGIINEWHEPPIFHGVERPSVDRVIIPTTWREGGIGVFGEPVEGLRYQLYLLSGLDAAGFSSADGLRGGRQAVSQARADGLALAGRIEVEPALGLVAGLSGYAGLAGPNAELFDAAGEALELDVPVVGGGLDVRGRLGGLEARALVALFAVGDTAELREAFDADGNALELELDPGSLLYGAYGEVAYDVLYPLRLSHALLPFVRLERYDPEASTEGVREDDFDDASGVTELVLGLTYKPLTQIAFKADFVLESPQRQKSRGRFDLGLGLMF